MREPEYCAVHDQAIPCSKCPLGAKDAATPPAPPTHCCNGVNGAERHGTQNKWAVPAAPDDEKFSRVYLTTLRLAAAIVRSEKKAESEANAEHNEALEHAAKSLETIHETLAAHPQGKENDEQL